MGHSTRCPARPRSTAFRQRARGLTAALLLAAALASCSDKENQQIADLRNQIAARDRELADIRAKQLESVRNEAHYKGALDALQPRLEDDLKSAIATCNRGTDAETQAELTKVRAACDATNVNIQKVLAAPAPAAPVAPAPNQEPAAPGPDQGSKPQPGVPPATDNTKPVTPSDPPPPGGKVADQQSMEETVLLAGAFLACQYYSAGTCSIVLAAVGLKLGLGPGEVKEKSQHAYETLKADVDRRGIALPDPTGGEPIVLRPGTIAEVVNANKAFSALPEADRGNPCKVIEIYRHVTVIAPFMSALSNPLFFRSPEQKKNAVKVARDIDLTFSTLLERIPVQGQGKGLSCG
jgi:hypothetical protein